MSYLPKRDRKTTNMAVHEEHFVDIVHIIDMDMHS